MNIILIGIGGSGKSTIGKLLAKKLGNTFMDTDTMVEDKLKMTIPNIVEKFGWDKFRDFESQIIDTICKLDNTVISSGGGVVIRDENISKMKVNGTFIWLKANIDTLVERIGDGKNRPIFTSSKYIKYELKQIYSGRKKLYTKASNYIINTDNKTPQQIVTEIISYLKIGKLI